MSSWVWWTLAGSVLVGLIIMTVAAIITFKKIRAIKQRALAKLSDEAKVDNAKAFERTNHGKLLLDLKKVVPNPLGDDELEFALNTFYRNNYQTYNIFNNASEYEKTSFEELNQATFDKESYDFALFFLKDDAYDNNKLIKAAYLKLNDQGLIFVANPYKVKKRYLKLMLQDLKVVGYRHEFNKINKGVILIAK